MIQLFERVDEHDDRAHHHDGEVDGCKPSHHFGHLRVFVEHKGQQSPDDDSRDDTRGRSEHLLTEDHIVPLCLRLLSNFHQQGHKHLPCQPSRQPGQQEGNNHQYRITYHRHVVACQSCQTDHLLQTCLYRFHHFLLFLAFAFLVTFFSTFGCEVSNLLGSLITAQRRS